jgi:hypothetical protein
MLNRRHLSDLMTHTRQLLTLDVSTHIQPVRVSIVFGVMFQKNRTSKNRKKKCRKMGLFN